MEKEYGQVKITETDAGFRIEVTGKSLKEAFSCCCMPMFGAVRVGKSECCPPTKEKKQGK
jgi:hypothetical protein